MRRPNRTGRVVRSPITYLALAAVVAVLLFSALRSGPDRKTLALSEFEHDLSVPGTVVTATIHDDGDTVTGQLKDGTRFVVQYPDRLTEALTTRILASGATLQVSHATPNPWLSALVGYLPLLILLGLFLLVFSLVHGGGPRLLQFGKSRAKVPDKNQARVTFADVAGADEAVAELRRSKSSSRRRAASRPSEPRSPRGCCSSGRPAPVRRCWPGR